MREWEYGSKGGKDGGREGQGQRREETGRKDIEGRVRALFCHFVPTYKIPYIIWEREKKCGGKGGQKKKEDL